MSKDGGGGPDIGALIAAGAISGGAGHSNVSSGGGSSASGDHFIQHGAGDGMFAGVGKQSLDLGLGGNADDTIKLGASFESNPFTDIGDGTLVGPGNINALQEFSQGSFSTIGDTSLSNVGVGKQTNANLPTISSSQKQQR